MQYTTIFVLCTTNTVNNYIHVAIATFRLRMRQTRIHGDKGRSLTMLTKFCPLLTTYMIDIDGGILEGKTCIPLTFPGNNSFIVRNI